MAEDDRTLEPEEPRLRALVARFRQCSDARAAQALLLDYAVIAAAVALAAHLQHPLVSLAAMVVIAGRQVAFLNLIHAAAHGALFRRRRLNRALQLLFAYPILDSIEGYRQPHMEHHREIALGAADRFAFLHDELGLPRRGAWGRTWVVFIRPLLGYEAFGFLRGTARSLRKHRGPARRILGLWGVLLLVCWWLGGLALLWWYWIVPLLWLHPVFLLWGEVSDHFQARGETRNHVGPFHAALISGHGLYHAVHHRWPSIPFYQEAAACAALQRAGVTMETTRSAVGFVRAIY